MLKGISRYLSPELLKVLSEMGAGDTIVIAGANFPAAACAKENMLLRVDGVGTAQLLEAILRVFPLDESIPNPVQLVEKVAADEAVPTPIWDEYAQIVKRYDPRGADAIGWVDRYVFYTMATRAYAVVATTELAPYAGLLLQKGELTEQDVQ